jgi:LuxR family maltose regulon positive regulatory protein
MNRPKASAISKLAAPGVLRIVRRARVLSAIDRALRNGICWLAAPAGYGKTTALTDYLRKMRITRPVWYRVDEGDQDIASLFHYLAMALRPGRATRSLPAFGVEYADQPQEFARRFCRSWFAALPPRTLIVFDDLHYADVPPFRAVLATFMRELPDHLHCACLSREFPADEFAGLRLQGHLTVIDQSLLEFSPREARSLLTQRVRRDAAKIDVSAARGWAAGLVLLTEPVATGALDPGSRRAAVFNTLARHMFDALAVGERDALLKLSVLPEIAPDLACDLTGSAATRTLLARLHQRQMLVVRGSADRGTYQLHDLLRDYLQTRLTETFPAAEIVRLQVRAAELLHAAGKPDDAITLALRAGAGAVARRHILKRAEALLAEGKRATLIDWCSQLAPTDLADPWICYWLGTAHMADDRSAEIWLERAWSGFAERDDTVGRCLTAARAVLAKSDSWRTHDGLAAWTQRALELLHAGLPALRGDDELLVCSGMLRAVDFSPEYRVESPAVGQLTTRLLKRLATRASGQSTTMRMIASNTLIEHAGSTGKRRVFEQATDSVADEVNDPGLSSWALGLWLVGFGSVSGRYFPYARRGAWFASAQDALQRAIALGEREHLRGVEFGALYHLQLQLKLRGDLPGFQSLVERIAQIADSRYTTQATVVADCEAALHTFEGNFPAAYRACDRCNAAMEAGNEPPIERWPHYLTQFQVLLGDGKPDDAAAFLESVLHNFQGGVRDRTQACIHIARALAARQRPAGDYVERLREAMRALQASDWHAALLNLPETLASLCGDALTHEVEEEFCRALIVRRALKPPVSRPENWPWALRVRLFGGLRLERDAGPLMMGAKPPTRSLDILRALTAAPDLCCSLEELYDWLWPDVDGDQARAACEQALHRLRKLLGDADLVVLREGRLRLAAERVWIDLPEWERSLRAVLRDAGDDDATTGALERVFARFTGVPFHGERAQSWLLAATERARSKYIDLAVRLAQRFETRGDAERARAVYLRALDVYPTSERCFEALLRGRLAQADTAAALEDYHRYERVLAGTEHATASATIKALVAPLIRRS